MVLGNRHLSARIWHFKRWRLVFMKSNPGPGLFEETNLNLFLQAGHHQWHRSEYLPVSRGPMSAATIYTSQEEESGGLLLTGGFTATEVYFLQAFATSRI